MESHEIDVLSKKVQERIVDIRSISEEINKTNDENLKMKYEADEKDECEKLERHIDKIETLNRNGDNSMVSVYQDQLAEFRLLEIEANAKALSRYNLSQEAEIGRVVAARMMDNDLLPVQKLPLNSSTETLAAVDDAVISGVNPAASSSTSQQTSAMHFSSTTSSEDAGVVKSSTAGVMSGSSDEKKDREFPPMNSSNKMTKKAWRSRHMKVEVDKPPIFTATRSSEETSLPSLSTRALADNNVPFLEESSSVSIPAELVTEVQASEPSAIFESSNAAHQPHATQASEANRGNLSEVSPPQQQHLSSEAETGLSKHDGFQQQQMLHTGSSTPRAGKEILPEIELRSSCAINASIGSGAATSSYPQLEEYATSVPAFWKGLETDMLIYQFYYPQKPHCKWLAMWALQNRDWNYCLESRTWFLEVGQGSSFYFDTVKWCSRQMS